MMPLRGMNDTFNGVWRVTLIQQFCTLQKGHQTRHLGSPDQTFLATGTDC
jgi:hypothetical protein